MFKTLHKKQNGFTLIEIVIAIAIAAIIIPAVITLSVQMISINRSNTNQANAVNQLKNAINYITTDGKWPDR